MKVKSSKKCKCEDYQDQIETLKVEKNILKQNLKRNFIVNNLLFLNFSRKKFRFSKKENWKFKN